MNTWQKITVSLLLPVSCMSQNISGVYKIGQMLNRLNQSDTVYVVNFWATWCKPCVAELPSLDSLDKECRGTNVKVLLVSLDFKDELDSKVNPFLRSHKISASCVLLDEANGNDFIDRISEKWSGGIPATFYKKNSSSLMVENKMNLRQLKKHLHSFVSPKK
jgi:thiol-disulfide isomerase/thioredoxin